VIVSKLRRKMSLWRPPPDLALSDWADAYRRLSAESSSEAGRWRTSRAPFQRGIMDAMSDPMVPEVVVMKSAQVGWTEMLNNCVGYYIHQDPSPMLLLQPTLEMAQTWSKDRLAPMLRDTPSLRGLVKDARSRDSSTTILHKQFAGGHITMAGANSPASLASRPIRIVMCDEVDRFPASAGAEGDPVSLARKRTTTFHNRKLLIGSTPTIKYRSRIESAFLSSDQRYYRMPCPHCSDMIKFEWANVQWPDGEPEKASYWCQSCGSEITDRDKFDMLKLGEWVASNPSSRIAGFHIWEAYSPWATFGEMALNFMEAKKLPETLQTWINTALGQTWDDGGESIGDDELISRCEVYNADAPDGVLCITAGVDVQDDRLELEFVGWGRDRESWSLDYVVLHGDPAATYVWEQLDDQLARAFTLDDGGMLRVASACIDTGGHHTQEVYMFCKSRYRRRVYAIKGVGGAGRPLVGRPSRSNTAKVHLFPVGVDTAKDMVYSRLRIQEYGPGYCHFPVGRDKCYFEQMTSEKAVSKWIKGIATRAWVKKSASRRNEALDCRVYALAAFDILNANMDVLERKANSLYNQHSVSTIAPDIDQGEAVAPSRRANKAKSGSRKKSGFVGGWK